VSVDELLESVRARARGIKGLPAPASDDDLQYTETRLGFPLHPLHARVLLEIADGGLVPRMYGISSHGERDEGRGIVEMRDEFFVGKDGSALPALTVPLADLGCAAWLLVGTKTGKVLGFGESGLVETEHTLESWLRRWADGRDVVKEAFARDRAVPRIGMNPFTKRPMVFAGAAPLKGRRLTSWWEESR
jgi:hypothetical protein